MSPIDKEPTRPRSDDGDFLDRLSELDRNLSGSGEPAGSAATDPSGDFSGRRRSSAAAPRDPRPLLELFPPVQPDPEPADSVYQRASAPRAGHAAAVHEPPTDEVCAEEDLDATGSARRATGLAAALLLAMAAGATAAAYVFRADLAAILAAWQQAP